MTPEQSRQGGLDPAPAFAETATAEVPVDDHGCAEPAHVADGCCCSATGNVRFDGAQCCYVFSPCGCC
jgi:hypothetical protein